MTPAHSLPPMKAYYTDQFELPLPPEHRFPMSKYRLLRERLVALGDLAAGQLQVPPPATAEQLRLAHGGEYVRQVLAGELSPAQQRRIGFPWSPQLVARSRRSVGATIAAAEDALRVGVGINLAGGTHHAHADFGEGYCVFNDVVVAYRVLREAGRIDRAVVLDCDVHQGNGTAAMARDDARLLTFSIHCQKNFPLRKTASDLDVPLDVGTGDRGYLAALKDTVPLILRRAAPDLAFYVSGADPFVGDRLGRLALSKQGLAQRDRFVLDHCRERGIPVVVVMAGGYAEQIADVAEIHAATVRIALAGCR